MSKWFMLKNVTDVTGYAMRFLIRIKALSLPAQDLPDRSLSKVLLSVWMVAVGHWIISLWKGFGGQ